MQQAGLMNFIRTLLIILLIYYVFKILAKYLFPMFIKHIIHNAEKKYNNNQNNSNNQQIKDGETVIDKAPKQKNRIDNNVGEYTDYEDVE